MQWLVATWILKLLLISVADCQNLNLISIGDWGTGLPPQKEVAFQMGECASKTKIEYVLSTGDNFYEFGVDGVEDPQWNTTFSNVYSHPSLLSIPWLVVLGNHDYRTNPEAQIEYSSYEFKDSRWNMDNHYFSRKISSSDNSVSCLVGIAFIDSVYFAPDAEHSTDFEDKEKKLEAQAKWLDETLLNLRLECSWVLVVGHYPVFSVGDHGDIPSMSVNFLPIIKRHSIDAYLSGHDHSLQHLIDNEVQFFISGAGAKMGNIVNPEKTRAQKVAFAQVTNGFMLHEFTQKQLKTSFINSQGETIYTYSQDAKVFSTYEGDEPNPQVPTPIPDKKNSKSSSAAAVGIIVALVSVGILIAGCYKWKKNRGKFAFGNEEESPDIEISNNSLHS